MAEKMTKQDWWQALPADKKTKLASILKTSKNSLSQLFHSHYEVSPTRAKKLVAAANELEVGNQLTHSMLRPDLWANNQAA